MDYKFCINDFEGPLDLLLHLVKTSKMDIYEIDIKVIIDEYLEFIESEKDKNIDIASSYLVMASELIHLKSKMLVNDDSKEEVSEDEFTLTSEDDLRKKIVEYEKYKKYSEKLLDKFNKRSNFYTKSPSKLDEIVDNGEINFGGLNIEDLVDAINSFKKREILRKPLNTRITKREYSIEKRIGDIKKILDVRKRVEFQELFVDSNKDFLIITFLAILTMCKNEEVMLMQEDNFKPIMIERVQVS